MDMKEFLQPGVLVRHVDEPDWGVGQVQSVAGDRVTVNFPDQGKVSLRGSLVNLEIVHKT